MQTAQAASWGLSNPIPDLVADKADLVKFFEQGKFIVPYAVQSGKSAHTTLKLLYDLSELSPVQKSAIAAKQDFCFGNGVATFNGETENTDEFFDFLRQISIDPSEVTDKARASLRDEAICGTAFMLAQIAEVNGQYSASMRRLSPKNCYPCFDYDNQHADFNNTLLYSDKQVWSNLMLGTLKEEDWKIVGRWPKVTSRQIKGMGKVFETVVQMNCVGYEQEFWGRAAADTNWLYIDYQQANSTAKISGSEVLTKLFLLLQEPDPLLLEQAGKSAEDVKRSIAAGLRGALTNKGADSQSLASLFYTGEKPDVHQIGINRDSAWAKLTRENTVQNICAAHGIPASLIGLEEMRVGLGGTVVMDTLVKTNSIKVVPTQVRFERMFTNLMQFFASFTGFDIAAHKLKFTGPIPEMIAQLKEIRQTTTSNAQNTTDNAGSGNL